MATAELTSATLKLAPLYSNKITVNNGKASVEVKGTYIPSDPTEERISVDVSWGAMTFTYNEATENQWDSTTHSYTSITEANWTVENGANMITVTNHSNTAIEARLSFASEIGIQGSFTETVGTANDGIMRIESAVGTEFAQAPEAVAYFNVIGGAITNNVRLGSITVAIVNK